MYTATTHLQITKGLLTANSRGRFHAANLLSGLLTLTQHPGDTRQGGFYDIFSLPEIAAPKHGRQARLSSPESASSLSACRSNTCTLQQVTSPRGQRDLGGV